MTVLEADNPAMLKQLAIDAYIWGIPLVQTRMYLELAERLELPFNQLFGTPELCTPQSLVPLPNVDTLYGIGWLDLTTQPQLLSVPEAHDRYYLVQLNDAYLNSFSYIGRRTTGTAPGLFAICGPGWEGDLPEGAIRVDAPTNHVLVITRVMVVDRDDLAEALRVQQGLSLTGLSDFPRITNPNRPIDDAFDNFPILQPARLGARYFDELCAGLLENPPPEEDGPFLEKLTALGIRPGAKPSQSRDGELVELLDQAASEANAIIHGRAGWLIDTRDVNGWQVSYGITQRIEDPLDRAVVAKLGPGCLVPQEGLYFSLRQGPDGELLSGDKSYALIFPPGQTPPVDAFWSLTMYGDDWSLVENPIDRYAISNRTPGLRYEDDGSLILYIQHERPASGTSNWLPCPPPGSPPFHLFMRTYQPRAELSDGRYEMPPLQLGDSAR